MRVFALYLFVLLLLFSCKKQQKTLQDEAIISFADNALLIDYDKFMIVNYVDSINAVFNDQFAPIKNSTLSLFFIQANAEKKIDYEIVQSLNSDKKLHKSIILWQTQGNEKKKELEFIAQATPNIDFDTLALTKTREQWMATCNSHDVRKLVEEFYKNPPLYYNHKPLVTDSESLIEEYSYMAREDYSLTLSPLHIEPLQDDLIYEIGQCSGSYNGKYILVWERDDSGKWKIFFDSNI